MTDNTNPMIDEAQEPQDLASGNREAAKYRRQLREAEAARDALQSRVDVLTKHAVDAAITAAHTEAPGRYSFPERYKLRHVGDLETIGGVTAEALIGDDGLPDQAKVSEALAGLHATRPELFVRLPGRGAHVPDPTQGQGTPPRDLGEEWAGAFGPRS